MRLIVGSTLLALALPACATPPQPSQRPPATTPAPPPAPSATRTVDVVETTFGITVADPYRWMEGADNPEAAAWLRDQGKIADEALAKLPGRAALLARLRELDDGTSSARRIALAGDRIFYYRHDAGAQLPKVVVRAPDGTEKVLLDPERMGGTSGHASIDNIAPSPDGTRLAYNVAWSGSELSEIRVLDVATGADLPDVLPRIWGEFPAVWLPDGKAFLYTQLAPPGPGVDPMLGMRGHLHVLGQPVTSDVAILGGDLAARMRFAPEEFPFFQIAPGSQWVIASGGGARSEFRVAVARIADLDRSGRGQTPWREVATYADSVDDALTFGDRLYLQTFRDAPNRRVVSVPLASPDLAAARVEVPESEATLTGLTAARDGLYVRQMTSGRGTLVKAPWKPSKNDLRLPLVPMPFDGWVNDFGADPARDGIVFGLVGWTHATEYQRYEPKTGTRPVGIGMRTAADLSSILAEEIEVTAADGAKVPLTILRRKDLALDGSHPTILNGYGAYGISLNPSFDPLKLAWLERGGIYAIAHVRGGGEKGQRWKLDGSGARKLNGVRDLIACAEHLIRAGYTRPQHLAATGGSAGGILIGRAITERPELFAAAQIGAGMVNPLRMLAAANGANQKAEFGDPETEAGFQTLLSIDPYQHVQPGTAYPAVIFTVGLTDQRVAPWMSAKMAARLQAATTGGRPVLVRIDTNSGHGIGSTRDQYLASLADAQSFLLWQTGDPAFSP